MHGYNLILILLLQVAVILALSRVMGLVFRWLRQPQVMGEMVAGIMLGPSLLGLLFPVAAARLFPPQSIVYLSVLSQVGVIFFLFLIGLELDPRLLRSRGHTALVVSHVSIVAPFLLGAALALYLYPRLFNDAPHMRFSSVALFMGAAMSVTAFPVLARILTERNLHKTNVGAIAITCAAVDDVTAWCMLAFVIGIARAEGLVPGLITAALSAAYVLFMFLAVRPFLRRLQAMHERHGRLTQGVVATIFLLVLLSAAATEAIGIHALFGAFLMGAIMPKGTGFVRALSEKLEDYTVAFLLPIFFAYTGLRTQIGLLDRTELWFDTALITAVACLGKFGGSALAGRACGLAWREASAIGILMNTRGLMELVILNIGLQEGVITPAVFAMMVIMALVTTAMTTPFLAWIYPARLILAGAAGVEAARKTYSVLVPVALPESGAAMARLADTLVDRTDGKLVALHLIRPADHEAFRSGLTDVEAVPNEALAPLTEEAQRLHLTVRPVSYVTRDVAADIAEVAAAHHVDLVLMGFHKPVFGKTMLGGTVHRVMTQCETDVGVFVDRGFEKTKRILVPFLGSEHDRLAMDLAGRMSRNTGAEVTILHVVPPSRNGKSLDAKATIEQAFADPAVAKKVVMRVVEDRSPVQAVLREASGFDLAIIGVSERWGLESHLFGWRPERIAREAPTSLLIVRRFRTPPAEAPVVAPAPVAASLKAVGESKEGELKM
jgi:Kef-type K+ transport system membrane component KefB/nucleotide-binding universal stress UspA family protein